jgi:hypothetical protein
LSQAFTLLELESDLLDELLTLKGGENWHLLKERQTLSALTQRSLPQLNMFFFFLLLPYLLLRSTTSKTAANKEDSVELYARLLQMPVEKVRDIMEGKKPQKKAPTAPKPVVRTYDMYLAEKERARNQPIVDPEYPPLFDLARAKLGCVFKIEEVTAYGLNTSIMMTDFKLQMK